MPISEAMPKNTSESVTRVGTNLVRRPPNGKKTIPLRSKNSEDQNEPGDENEDYKILEILHIKNFHSSDFSKMELLLLLDQCDSSNAIWLSYNDLENGWNQHQEVQAKDLKDDFHKNYIAKVPVSNSK